MKKEIATMENIMGTVGELTGLSKQLMYSTNQLAESTKAIYVKLAENDEKLNLVTTAISSIQDKMNHQLLNENVVTCINENAQSYYDKCIEKYNKEVFGNEEDYWGELPAFSMENDKNVWKIPDTYLTAQSILTNELIKIGHKDLEFSAEDFIKSNEDDPEFSF